MRKSRYILFLALIGILVFVFAGCTTRGGGWVEGRDGGKATFGFTCKTEEDPDGIINAKGNLVYNDHGAGIRIKGEVLLTFEDQPGQTEAMFFGETDEGLPFEVYVIDRGEPGVDAGDYFEILTPGYFNSGEIGGGNIQVFEPKEKK